MRKRLLASLLSLIMLAGFLSPPAFAAEDIPLPGEVSESDTEHWFYNQLTPRSKSIYDIMASMDMRDGVTSYDLVANNVVDQKTVEEYLNGNRTLFNDFAAAKDAFDLEHPEAWYVDSSDLSFLVTSENGGYHVYIGPGRTENYYIDGVAGKADVESKSAKLEAAVDAIAAGAREKGSVAEQVAYVHEQITKRISYRSEADCAGANLGYIRTAYALVTHEGVCEGYARSFQYVLNKLGIPCVLIHGVQTSGEPEAHMWCAVQLSSGSGANTAGPWYVVDPTWDDPVGLDAGGNIKTTGVNGVDGGETETYLLVGQDVVGANWQPSGYVSTGTMEFRYPEIAQNSYKSSVLKRNGLKVTSFDSEMESSDSTVYHVSFNGDGVVEAAKKGYYFLVRMYDINADGSMDAIIDWYYAVHGLHGVASKFDKNNDFSSTNNPYYYDSADHLTMNDSTCEYVEFAITTKAPPAWETADDLLPPDMGGLGGYYSGDGTDIIAETGLIYNERGNYEQPPSVRNASPGFNVPVYVGTNYTIHIEFTDTLYHPDRASVATVPEDKLNDAGEAMGQAVTLDYTGTTHSWGVNGRQPHTFADKPKPQNARWVCETHGTHTGMSGIDADCRLTTLEYEFSASKMWADDSVQYSFQLTGLVGRKSNKFPQNGGWSYVFENLSAYCAYRCPLKGGIDWNLWGQPQLLDNPNDLDFDQMTVKGVDGKEQDLADLRKSMHLDDTDMNGRLVLVVENLDASRSKTEELANAISKEEGIDVSGDAVLGSSLYEIDFARICSKTIVKTGQSLRLQVGFPPGIDASMAGVVFKVYHFTRDADGEINGVEEIPVTVTQYGLIILVDSFSPFAIVALDAKEAGLTVSNDRYVVLTSGGNGKVTSADADKSGKVTFDRNSTHEFTIEPADGYVLDTITLDSGKKIEVKDNKFTLKYSDLDGGNLLNVTFVKESIKAADAQNGVTVETPKVCRHEHLTSGSIAYQAASCTDAGHTDGKTCADCGQVLSVSKKIEALGHQYIDGKCERCGKEQSHETAPAPKPSYAVTLTASPSRGGSVTGSGIYEEDQSVTVRAVPAGGYRFVYWAEDGVAVSTSAAYHFTAAADRTLTAVFERISSGSSGGSSSGSSGSGSNSGEESSPGSGGDTTVSTENPDGSITTTVTDLAAGIVTETTIYPDGAVKVVETTGTGTVTTRETTADGVQITTVRAMGAPVTASVTIPADMDSATVTIPAEVTPGTVAIDAGTGEVIRLSVPTADGLTVRLDHSANFVLEDRSSDFSDTGSHWARESITFVAARGLLRGTSDTGFDPEIPMTRAMLVTVLARFDGAETDGGSIWYEKSMAWAVANGISDGSDLGRAITREELATMLYRYVRHINASFSTENPPLFVDADSVSAWAAEAMDWAVGCGLIQGMDGQLNPQGTATRAQVATILMRLCENILQS